MKNTLPTIAELTSIAAQLRRDEPVGIELTEKALELWRCAVLVIKIEEVKLKLKEEEENPPKPSNWPKSISVGWDDDTCEILTWLKENAKHDRDRFQTREALKKAWDTVIPNHWGKLSIDEDDCRNFLELRQKNRLEKDRVRKGK